jgi:hypothetical protein
VARIPKILQPHIDAAFPANVCLVGSVLPNEFAQITPHGSTMAFDDERIALWERGRGSTDENLAGGAPLTVYFRKPNCSRAPHPKMPARLPGTTNLRIFRATVG